MPAETLPNWVSYLQGLATPAIAGAGIVIAWTQYRLAKDRFRHDLFDRRYAVFNGIREASDLAFSDGTFTMEALNEFKRATNDADFLFNKEVVEFVGRLRQKLGVLVVNNPYRAGVTDDMAEQHERALVWVVTNTESDVLTPLFKPYIGFSGKP